MVKVILDWLSENASGILIFLAGGFVFWAISKFYYTRFQKVETQVDKLTDLEKQITSLQTANKITDSVNGRIEKTLDEKIVPKLDRTINALNLLVSHVAVNDTTIKLDIFRVSSPIQISHIGQEILDFYEVTPYLKKTADNYVTKIEKTNPQTALDIESEARQLLMEGMLTKDFNPVKDKLFNHPNFKPDFLSIKMVVPVILELMTIYIRNEYIIKHSELDDPDWGNDETF
jgi:hypothetical protein